MNFALFIANRIASGRGDGKFSGLIIRIAILAIALSMTVMLLTTALISGFKFEIRNKIFGFWGHIHLAHSSVSHQLESFPIDKNQTFVPSIQNLGPLSYQKPVNLPFTNKLLLYRNASTEGGIRHLQSFVLKPGIIKAAEEMEGIIIKGVGEEFDWNFLQNYLIDGKPISWNDTVPSREMIISKITADRLQLSAGESIIIYFVNDGKQIRRKFTIGGIYKTGLAEYDKKFAIADIRVLQQLMGWDENEISGFEVFLDNMDDMEIIKSYLLEFELPYEVLAETIRDKDPGIFDWLDLQDINEMVILMLMIIVAIINTITTLLILILERTNMIGTLKALGAKSSLIQKIFLIHAGHIVGKGLLWGNFFGLGLAFIQDQFKLIRLSEVDYFLSYAPIHWSLSTILLLNMGTLLITLIFLIIPSFLVSSISPVKSLRFE